MMTKNNIRFTTPTGFAQYPYLNSPDTKFNPEGDYKVNLLLPEDTKTKELIDKLDAVLIKFMETSDDVKRAIAQRKTVTKGDIVTYDEEGNVVFKFKQKAVIHTKDGKDLKVSIPIFDSKGKPCNGAMIGSESKIKVNFSVFPYYMPTTKTCGLSLRPVAVQVIELVEPKASGTAESYGFGEEEGGFEYTEEPAAAPEEDSKPWDNLEEDYVPNKGDF